MKRISFLFLIFLTSFSLIFTQKISSEIRNKIEEGVNFSKSFTHSNEVLIEEKDEIILDGDCNYTQKLYQLSTILNENGIKNLSTVFFFYYTKSTKIELSFARTIKKNGDIIDVPYNYIGKKPAGKKEDGFYQFYIKFPDLEVGDSIEYEIKFYVKNLLEKNYCDFFPFKYPSPIFKKEVSIKIPAGRKLFFKWRNGKFLSEKIKNGKYVKYSFKGERISPLKSQMDLPPITDISPTLYVSTFKSWKELSKFGLSESEKATDFSEEMGKKLNLITKKSKDIEDKIFKIYYYITENIDFNPYSFNTGAFIKPHMASKIFKNRYGICRDKTIVLMAFLKKLGLKPVECLINFAPSTFPEIPTIYFDHSIVKVKLKNGKTIYLDPYSYPPTYKSSTAISDKYILPLTEKGSELEKLPHIPANKNQLKISALSSYKIGDILKASITIDTYGIYDTFFRSILKRVGSYNIYPFFSNVVKYIHPNATIPIPPDYVEPLNFSSNEAVLLTLEVKNYPVKLGKFLLFKPILSNIPFDPYLMGIFNKYLKVKKIYYPFYLISPVSLEVSEELDIPKDRYKFETFPENINLKKGPIEFSLKFENLKSNILKYTLKIYIDSQKITPQIFPYFKKICEFIKEFKSSIILVKLTTKEVKKDEKK